MDMGLTDKVVAITGGTSGIGEEVALAFAQEGAKVAVCGRSRDKLEAVAGRFQALGLPLYTQAVDVTDNAQLEDFAQGVAGHYGRLDVWVSNAGSSLVKPCEQVSEEEFYSLVDVDLKSVFFGAGCAARQMRKTGGGVIINTSSITAMIPSAGRALYGALKSAVNSLTRSLAAELAADHIRVVAIAPGFTVTPLTEPSIAPRYEWLVSSIAMNRLATPQDMVGGYLYLASPMAEYVDGVCLEISGGKFATQNSRWSWEQAAAREKQTP